MYPNCNRAGACILFFISVVGQVLPQDADYCYAYNNNPYLKMNTRTAYSFVRGRQTSYEAVPNCKPVQIWMFIRHGTRYMALGNIPRLMNLYKIRDEIIDNQVRGFGRLCEADLENLKNWNMHSNVRLESGKLSKQGIKDMNHLGKRIKNNFPELFSLSMNQINSKNYKFRSAIGERMTSSLKAFMLGLLGRADIPFAESPTTDALFTAYQNCPRWETEVANNPEYLIEVTKFTEGLDYQTLILNVSQRLGYQNNITTDTIRTMWDMCCYEMAWRIGELSPWCAVFSEEELKIIEFLNDLTDYYKRGYGHEFNIRLGCPPMQDLFQQFQKLEGGNYSNQPKGIFNIGRSGSLLLFLAAMGFARDPTPLLASDFRSMSNYKWKTTEIGSFSANIAAVFYKCNDTQHPNKVKFYMAEKPISYEGCDSGLCDWEYLKNKFKNTALSCNPDFCYMHTQIWSYTAVFTGIILLALFAIVFIFRRYRFKVITHHSVRFWKGILGYSAVKTNCRCQSSCNFI